MAEPPPLDGLVLAGGRSERLGRDKAAVHVGGSSLLERAVGLLRPWTRQVRVAIRADQSDDPVRVCFACVLDVADGIGPAAGICAGHAAAPGAALLVLACDMPRITDALISRLVQARDPARAATAFRGAAGPEPLCAIYEPATLAAFQRQVLAGGNASPRAWLAGRDTGLLDAPPGAFDSINEPGDLAGLAELERRDGSCRGAGD